MENNFDAPLLKLKEEIDSLELKIVGCQDIAATLKPYVNDFNDNKKKRKKFIHEKRVKMQELKIISNFYKQATGEEPDGIYPLFNKTA